MKKLSLLLVLLLALNAMPAFADGEDVVYGTMQIPYDLFYAAEGVEISVDAVSSATNAKWKNEGLVGGTYYAEHTEDEGGDILGVVYPVAISQADLTALGEDNCGFTALDEAPAAWKTAALTDGALSFSAVEGESEVFEAEVVLTTESKYGDYQITVNAINNQDGTSDIGTIYGVLLKTEDGVYALRHLENIWRDNLAFGAGFKEKESHGNTLNPENYAEMMGKTITAITYITETGYHTIETSLYVPVKFDGGVAVADAPTAEGQTAVTLTGIPEDYALSFAAKGLEITVENGVMSFGQALPGSYTLTTSDANGVYADVLASFILSTDVLPVAYDAESKALVPAEGADEALAAAFIKNIAKVTVNDTAYNAAGKGAVAVIDEDGAVDAEAVITKGKGKDATTEPVFPEAGTYALTVEATGFDQAISFDVEIAD
ncbi:MAG: hypothetical protein IJ048_10135 [Clostridia bacterium]|nr:hypothetical protein [Clostridia bacterium]